MLSLIPHNDAHWMAMAIASARQAEAAGEVPVGAVVVAEGEVLAEGWNQPISRHDPSAHAEIVALRKAAEKMGNYRLPGTTLYVTLEPCMMCVGAIVHARVAQVVFGAPDPKAGAVQSAISLFEAPHHNHQVLWRGGVLSEDCGSLLQAFFKRRR